MFASPPPSTSQFYQQFKYWKLHLPCTDALFFAQNKKVMNSKTGKKGEIYLFGKGICSEQELDNTPEKHTFPAASHKLATEVFFHIQLTALLKSKQFSL